MKRDIPLEEIQKAYLAGMAKGYASYKSDLRMTIIPGSHVITERIGEFLVTDLWMTTDRSDMSYGHTSVSIEGEPLWAMTYRGCYPKRVIPFLKQCLLRAYVTEPQFNYGRGPTSFQGESYTYAISGKGDFSKFSASEGIWDRDFSVQPIGYHQVYGFSMMTDDVTII